MNRPDVVSILARLWFFVILITGFVVVDAYF